MTQPGIEPRSPRPLANTLPTQPLSVFYHKNVVGVKKEGKITTLKFKN